MKTVEQLRDELLPVVQSYAAAEGLSQVGEVMAALRFGILEARKEAQMDLIYIVQNDAGDVIGVYADADDAALSMGSRRDTSIIEETITDRDQAAEIRKYAL